MSDMFTCTLSLFQKQLYLCAEMNFLRTVDLTVWTKDSLLTSPSTEICGTELRRLIAMAIN